jgi:hypothetical protein
MEWRWEVTEALEKEVKRLIQAERDKGEQDIEIDFCKCSKWNGVSNKCSCGSVRVYWEWYLDSKLDIYLYPAVS